jgi:hypothetical protein
MLRGVDVSEFTREIPPQWWKDLRDEHNVEVAIVQCWGGGPNPGRSNTYFEQQARGALDAGLMIGTYCWPPRDAQYAVNFVRDSSVPLKVFALDVEAGAIAIPGDATIVTNAGFDPWLYGNRYTIEGLPHREALRDLPLWLARYPHASGPVYWPEYYAPYGLGDPVSQWPNPQGWQFQGTTAYQGETMDLNLFRDFPEGESHMSTPEYEELKQRIGDLEAAIVWGARQIAEQLEALRIGDVDVPIWPIGDVSLSIVRHRGYHAAPEDHDHV